MRTILVIASILAGTASDASASGKTCSDYGSACYTSCDATGRNCRCYVRLTGYMGGGAVAEVPCG
jgi:hypothetical protein